MRFPNEKITMHTNQPDIYPATLREVGPLNNNVREAPITTIMYRRMYCTKSPTSTPHLGTLQSIAQVNPKGHTSQHLGCTFQRDGHGKRQIDTHLVYNVLFHLRHQMVYTSELLGDVQPFTPTFPHRIRPVKTDPPPIQHSRHNPQKELLHIIQQHQELLSKCVPKSIEHSASWNMSFLVTSPAFHIEASRNSPTYCVLWALWRIPTISSASSRDPCILPNLCSSANIPS